MPDDRLMIAQLASLSLAGSGLRRELPVRPEARTPGYEEAYDFDTLWYDSYETPTGVTLICPRLFNLRRVLEAARISRGGTPLRIARIRRYRRHEIVELAGTGQGALRIDIGDWHEEVPVSPDQNRLFAGMNAALTVSRNNRLDWIADWARFHIDEHGLEALLFFDNGSTTYAPQAILDALEPLDLKRVIVIPVSQSYGPTRVKRGSGGMNFLQVALQNIARLRFMAKARGVLLSDVDELVWRHGPTLFDAAAASFLGLAIWPGHWVVPRPGAGVPAHHADHTHMAPELGSCPTKYCIVPSGRLRRLNWDVHRPERLPFAKRLVRRDLGFWHCKGITDNWKPSSERGAELSGSHEVAEVAAKLAERFPQG